MDLTGPILAYLSYFVSNLDANLPPDVCFENFRWDDCGMAPRAVLYYYKPGSRCEVGLWRGCEPNPNMFKDEYECINTCIFSIRARPEDYHKLQAIPDYPAEEIANTTEFETTTTTTVDDDGESSGTESNGASSDASPAVTEAGEATVASSGTESPAVETPAEDVAETLAPTPEPAPAERRFEKQV